MRCMFVDESVHDRGDFILGPIVYCGRSPNWRVNRALRAVGLRPGFDEYKSGDSKAGNCRALRLRERLGTVAQSARIGVAVVPRGARRSLGCGMLKAVNGPNVDINIGFEMWARQRYSFFSRPRPEASDVYPESRIYDGSCGLYVSDGCPERLAAAALRRFGTCYLGCIH
jgi:hypothetical protein